MRSRWLDQIVWLEGKANESQRWYYALRLVAIVGGLIVPALVSLNVNDGDLRRAIVWTTFAVSLVVAIARRRRGLLPLRRPLAPLPPDGRDDEEPGLAVLRARRPVRRRSRRTPPPSAPFAATVEALFPEDVDTYVNRVMREGQPSGSAEAEPKTGRTLLLTSVEERELVEVDGLLAGSAAAGPAAQDGL